ncbi:hypothetical protein R1flu_003354 [Riccia fluitans]|uniref:Secreted protein n=1 Tax=Riccia fluitans TaxID=41844 RepID=A0ABD1YCH8_9MARC
MYINIPPLPFVLIALSTVSRSPRPTRKLARASSTFSFSNRHQSWESLHSKKRCGTVSSAALQRQQGSFETFIVFARSPVKNALRRIFHVQSLSRGIPPFSQSFLHRYFQSLSAHTDFA